MPPLAATGTIGRSKAPDRALSLVAAFPVVAIVVVARYRSSWSRILAIGESRRWSPQLDLRMRAILIAGWGGVAA
jgi:hypothetical protein